MQLIRRVSPGQSIVIGDTVITVVEFVGSRVTFGVEASKDLSVVLPNDFAAELHRVGVASVEE